MVKLVCFIKRKPGMSLEAFYDHWENHHGPLIAATPELARHIARYEQHRRDPLTERLGGADHDGVAVQWFDSAHAFMAFVSEPVYSELIIPDEDAFLDRDSLVWMLTEEPVTPIAGGNG